MYENLIFYLLLMAQVFFLSYYFPRKILKRMRLLIETYPPSAYPKLYPRPIEAYDRAERLFRRMNHVFFVGGVVLIAILLGLPRSGEWDHAIVTWYFMFQCLPLIVLDVRAHQEFKLMRKANESSTRKAELKPRRLRNCVSPTVLRLAVVTYLGFVGFILYLKQFEFSWFGGYWNIVGITVFNLFILGVISWNLYGKKLDPHQAPEDRQLRIEKIARILIFTSIAATLHIAFSIGLNALELRHLRPTFQCVYLLVLATICMQAYFIRVRNFDVYKADTSLSR